MQDLDRAPSDQTGRQKSPRLQHQKQRVGRSDAILWALLPGRRRPSHRDGHKTHASAVSERRSSVAQRRTGSTGPGESILLPPSRPTSKVPRTHGYPKEGWPQAGVTQKHYKTKCQDPPNVQLVWGCATFPRDPARTQGDTAFQGAAWSLGNTRHQTGPETPQCW